MEVLYYYPSKHPFIIYLGSSGLITTPPSSRILAFVWSLRRGFSEPTFRQVAVRGGEAVSPQALTLPGFQREPPLDECHMRSLSLAWGLGTCASQVQGQDIASSVLSRNSCTPGFHWEPRNRSDTAAQGQLPEQKTRVGSTSQTRKSRVPPLKEQY